MLPSLSMTTERFSPWITVLVSVGLTYFFHSSPLYIPIRSLSDLSYSAISSGMIFFVVFNHLKAIVFNFLCVTYLQKFPLEKNEAKQAQANTNRRTHKCTTQTYICQTKNLKNKPVFFPPADLHEVWRSGTSNEWICSQICVSEL